MGEGARYACAAHITSAKLITAGVQDPFKGPGSSGVLDALSCLLRFLKAF